MEISYRQTHALLLLEIDKKLLRGTTANYFLMLIFEWKK